ncbi:biosynthetic-type acetolactate synthase large subunit [Lachnoclostridium sp. Marseille-P6806]|uniref:biosynthetic-type acetolactate synthase large subunit n=1 Tax=Lachnoclostridium sp. Marseille-P6806 TaxID=2364793 RepID=UPI001031572F|nr:biosynthetic-type acetolactate synthase large subunit [Lachnoclostridium sp. Marseille-P6806]
MNGADAAVRCLEAEEVEYVFGYPGVAICPFYDSILNTEIRTILVRQEQNAAHEASGYSRISGKVGVVAVTSGPGAENLITGIATAFADSIPMVCITGQVDTGQMGSDVFQEADISGAVESFVKYSYIVRRAADVSRIFREAFYIANSGRKGPVLIDFPADIQKETLSRFSYPETVSMRTYKPTVSGNMVQIRKVAKQLGEAERPIMCIGGGVHLAGAAEQVRDFAERHGIPVVCTMMGLSAMPTEHPLFFGMVGNNGQACANRAMNAADLVIMAGARVADRSINRPAVITEGKTLVHIDVDPAEIGKNVGPNIPLVGDIRAIFDALGKEELTADYTAWAEELGGFREEERESRALREESAAKTRAAGAVDPRAFIRRLTLAMEKDGVYVADVGQNQMWSCSSAVIREGRFLTSGGMGTMGYSVGAALGAKLAAPARQVVAVTGDGAFQMSFMELGTACQYGVPLKIVVLRNDTLGLVRQHQHFVYRDRYSVTDLTGSPRLDRIAEAYGMRYERLDMEVPMEECIRAFLDAQESVLLEVIVDPDEIA